MSAPELPWTPSDQPLQPIVLDSRVIASDYVDNHISSQQLDVPMMDGGSIDGGSMDGGMMDDGDEVEESYLAGINLGVTGDDVEMGENDQFRGHQDNVDDDSDSDTAVELEESVHEQVCIHNIPSPKPYTYSA